MKTKRRLKKPIRLFIKALTYLLALMLTIIITFYLVAFTYYAMLENQDRIVQGYNVELSK